MLSIKNLEALRDSPIACDCMGVSVYRFKVIAFVISAAFAGLAGCLYAYSEQYISPNTYNNELAVLFLLAIISGGGVVFSAASGNLDLSLAAPFSLGALCGLLIGRALGKKLSGPRLQQIFAILTFGVAISLSIKGINAL